MTASQGALPIVVALCGDEAVTAGVLDRARPLLERELASLKRQYPHSPIAIAAACGLEPVANAAAKTVGAYTVAAECHASCDLVIESGRDASGTLRVRLDHPRRAPWELSEAQHQGALEHTEQFNHDASRLRARNPAAIDASARTLAMPRDIDLADAAQHLRELFATADALALQHQRLLKWTFRSLFIIGGLATLVFSLFHVFEWRPLGVPFLGLVAGGLALYWVAKRAKIHDRFVQYRALAETARVQFYWEACGIRDSTRDHCVTPLADELAWIHDALLSVLRARADGPREKTPAVTSEVLNAWVADQGGYFRRSARPARRHYPVWNRIANALFWVGVASVVLLFVKEWHVLDAVVLWVQRKLGLSTTRFQWLSLLSLLLPAASGIIKGYLAKTAMAYQEKHYTRMATIYARAAARLANPPAEGVSRLAIELGRQALQENAQWATVMLEAGIDPPPTPITKRME